MHKKEFCHKLLEKALPKSLHKKRKDCLVRFVSSLLDYDTNLSVTEIGKKLSSNTTVKHKIKAADYFIGNEKMYENIQSIYQSLAQVFWKDHSELTILVDGSGACDVNYYTFSASVLGHGRSIPIYQKVIPRSLIERPSIHREFLHNLYKVVPKGAKVTIITDGGFKRAWFRDVQSLGWDYISRVGAQYLYKDSGSDDWKSINTIPFSKNRQPKAIGEVRLGRTGSPFSGYLYTYKPKLTNRPHKPNKYPQHEKEHSHSYRKGWVICSSLNTSAKKIMKLYKTRMQIEQNFRDIKSEAYGIGLRRSSSKSIVRVGMLNFLATLLTMIMWWIGLSLESRNIHRRYQANTVKKKRVISFISLAKLVLRHEPHLLSWKHVQQSIRLLQIHYQSFTENGVLEI